MDIASIGQANSYTKAKLDQATEMGQGDFLKLIVAQLKFQDPLQPVDNFDFMSQTAQFNLLDQVIGLSNQFSSFARSHNLAYANSLIGKNITWESDDGSRQAVVEKVELKEGIPWVVAAGQRISTDSITAIAQDHETGIPEEE